MKKQSARPTITDVAKRANVSTATVSRVIQTPEIVSVKTREKVSKAIRETGYRINSAAQNLRRNTSGAILVVVPDIGNTFFSEILVGIEQVASQADYTILIGDTGGDQQRCQKLLGFLRNGRADGALLLNGNLPPLDYPLGEIAVVSVSEAIEGADIPHVGTDNVAAARDATNALIDLGHQQIMHICGPSENILTGQRIAGYKHAMKAAGLERNICVVPAGFSAESGRNAAKTVLQLAPRPTAIFCSNDETAMGVISKLVRSGLSVPDDISVCGFDDIHFSATFIPQISTIRQARLEIGREALRQLLSLLNDKLPVARTTFVPHEFVQRESTAPLP